MCVHWFGFLFVSPSSSSSTLKKFITSHLQWKLLPIPFGDQGKTKKNDPLEFTIIYSVV